MAEYDVHTEVEKLPALCYVCLSAVPNLSFVMCLTHALCHSCHLFLYKIPKITWFMNLLLCLTFVQNTKNVNLISSSKYKTWASAIIHHLQWHNLVSKLFPSWSTRILISRYSSDMKHMATVSGTNYGNSQMWELTETKTKVIMKLGSIQMLVTF